MADRSTRHRLERWGLRPLVFTLALTPAVLLLARAVEGTLGANPIETVTHETGLWALRLLLVTLAVTPLRRISGWSWPVRLRRMLGLFAFFYASAHLLTYVVLDQFFAWRDIVADVLKRPYITVGLLAFLLLVPLAATSTRGMMRRLGGVRWKRLHRLAYVAAGLGALHFLWLVKADLREPLIYAGLLAALLLARLSPAGVGSLLRTQASGLGRGSS